MWPVGAGDALALKSVPDLFVVEAGCIFRRNDGIAEVKMIAMRLRKLLDGDFAVARTCAGNAGDPSERLQHRQRAQLQRIELQRIQLRCHAIPIVTPRASAVDQRRVRVADAAISAVSSTCAPRDPALQAFPASSRMSRTARRALQPDPTFAERAQRQSCRATSATSPWTKAK